MRFGPALDAFVQGSDHLDGSLHSSTMRRTCIACQPWNGSQFSGLGTVRDRYGHSATSTHIQNSSPGDEGGLGGGFAGACS